MKFFKKTKNKKNNIENIKIEYNIQEDNIVFRLLELKNEIKNKKQKEINLDELISFLESAMNYDEMNIWFIKNQLKGIAYNLNDSLKKFFELKTNDDILRLYDLEQNYNQENIDSIKKTLKSYNNY